MKGSKASLKTTKSSKVHHDKIQTKISKPKVIDDLSDLLGSDNDDDDDNEDDDDEKDDDMMNIETAEEDDFDFNEVVSTKNVNNNKNNKGLKSKKVVTVSDKNSKRKLESHMAIDQILPKSSVKEKIHNQTKKRKLASN